MCTCARVCVHEYMYTKAQLFQPNQETFNLLIILRRGKTNQSRGIILLTRIKTPRRRHRLSHSSIAEDSAHKPELWLEVWKTSLQAWEMCPSQEQAWELDESSICGKSKRIRDRDGRQQKKHFRDYSFQDHNEKKCVCVYVCVCVCVRACVRACVRE